LTLEARLNSSTNKIETEIFNSHFYNTEKPELKLVNGDFVVLRKQVSHALIFSLPLIPSVGFSCSYSVPLDSLPPFPFTPAKCVFSWSMKSFATRNWNPQALHMKKMPGALCDLASSILTKSMSMNFRGLGTTDSLEFSKRENGM